jgi:hypothetical protein
MIANHECCQDWEIPGDNILKSYFPDVPVSNIIKLEGIANRDSIPYADTYDLGAIGDLRTVLRGTLRCVRLLFQFAYGLTCWIFILDIQVSAISCIRLKRLGFLNYHRLSYLIIGRLLPAYPFRNDII